MLKYLIPVAATLSLVAFAAQSRSEAVIDETPLEGGLAWHLSHEGETAKLAYGVAHSDQIVIMLTCAPGDRQVQAFGVVTPTGAAVEEGPVPVDPLTGLAMSDVAAAPPSPSRPRRRIASLRVMIPSAWSSATSSAR